MPRIKVFPKRKPSTGDRKSSDRKSESDSDANFQWDKLGPHLKQIGKLVGGTLHTHLGSGTYGQVYVLCKSHNTKDACHFVVKISECQEESEWDSAERDYLFLSALQNVRVKSSANTNKTKPVRIVPRVGLAHKFYVKNPTSGYFVIVMDRYTENMRDHIDRRQGRHANGLYTPEEWDQMLLIVNAMSKYGVVHGDLKPNQFLYRENANGQPSVVLTDFGFAGLSRDIQFSQKCFAQSGPNGTHTKVHSLQPSSPKAKSFKEKSKEPDWTDPIMGWPCNTARAWDQRARPDAFTVATTEHARLINLWQLYLSHDVRDGIANLTDKMAVRIVCPENVIHELEATEFVKERIVPEGTLAKLDETRLYPPKIIL